jgi:hypothetical protein
VPTSIIVFEMGEEVAIPGRVVVGPSGGREDGPAGAYLLVHHGVDPLGAGLAPDVVQQQ